MEYESGTSKLNGIHKPQNDPSLAHKAEESKIISRAKLTYEWVIWEHWQNLGGKTIKGQTAEDYKKDLKQVAEFDNLITFWQMWRCLPHADPKNFLTIEEESTGRFLRNQ